MLESRIDVDVGHGFIELAEPSIEEGAGELADGHGRVTVVPLSLFAAGHVKNDVPLSLEVLKRQHPCTSFHYGRHLGVHPAILDVLDSRAKEVEEEVDVSRREDDVVVLLVARGSSDPDSNADVHKLARLLHEGRGFGDVEPAFVGVTEPRVEDAFHGVARGRPDAVVALPYMLGDGVLTQRVKETVEDLDDSYPYVSAASGEPLGTDTRLLDVLADRWQEARTDSVDMSCDTCKYKVELDGYEEDVGGARAKLRALTHREVHEERGDEDTEPHVHDAPERHVVVCTNRSCAEDGAAEVLEHLRRRSREDDAEFQVTRTSCLDQCGDGPMVAVYPDGVWYGDVDTEDAGDVVDSHLHDGELVSEVVHQTL